MQKKTLKGAAAGLAAGTVGMTVIMVWANLMMTPLFLGLPRSMVIPLLPYVILFNLLKAGVNSAVTLLLIRKTGFLLRVPPPL